MRVYVPLLGNVGSDRFWARLAGLLILVFVIFDFGQARTLAIQEVRIYDFARQHSDMVSLPYSTPSQQAGDAYYFRFVMPEDRLNHIFPLALIPKGCLKEVISNGYDVKLDAFSTDVRCDMKRGITLDKLTLPGAGAVLAVAVEDSGKDGVGLRVVRASFLTSLMQLVLLGLVVFLFVYRWPVQD